MLSPDAIRTLIENALPDCRADVSVEGDQVHATVVSPVFAGETPVKKHKIVYAALNEPIASGAIHALNIRAFTPDEWAERGGDAT